MALEFMDFYNGLTGTIFVLISIFVAIKLISKYFEHKKRGLLFAGLTWLIICETYWPVAISFILVILTNSSLTDLQYFFIGAFLIPLGLLSWLVVFTDLVYKSKQKVILSLVMITGIVWEIFYMFFLFTNPSLIVLLGLIPTTDTPMKDIAPNAQNIAKIIATTRILFPHTPISLGCMRPGKKVRVQIDQYAIEAGVNRIEIPTYRAMQFASKKGLEIHKYDSCCAVPLQLL